MALSSNSVIHFTDKKESLFGILKNNFKLFFCREDIILGGEKWSYYVPMVSFCDIPMSEIKDHIRKYGSYGIGLTKEWALKNGLNPVLYVAPDSDLSKSYKIAIEHFLEDYPDNCSNEKEKKSLLNVLRYMKNYEGPLERKGQKIDKYRFSDEREWRHIPLASSNKQMIVVDDFFEKNIKTYSEIYKHNRLKFEPNDINYVIIKDDSEIKDVVHYFRSIKGDKYSLNEIERLATRILTAEQINGDF